MTRYSYLKIKIIIIKFSEKKISISSYSILNFIIGNKDNLYLKAFIINFGYFYENDQIIFNF